MSDDPNDPDVGRRALQCACGASRKHTSVREALAEGWGTNWTRRKGKDERVWFCSDCYLPPDPPQRAIRVPPSASRRFLDLARRGMDGELACMLVLNRLLDTDPAYAWRWFLDVLALDLPKRALQHFAEWADFHELWSEPMLAQHSSRSNEHFTPPEVCELAREALGGTIDLDPASCAQANTIVRARRFYAREDNGLSLPWAGTVFLNPPGDELTLPGEGRVSQAAYWWTHLVTRFGNGEGPIPAAVFVIFNLELLRHAQRWPVPQPLDFAVCVPRERLSYYRPTYEGPVRGDQPTHPSALVYLGPDRERFCALAAPFGYVVSR